MVTYKQALLTMLYTDDSSNQYLILQNPTTKKTIICGPLGTSDPLTEQDLAVYPTGEIEVNEVASGQTPVSGKNTIYFKSGDGLPYYKDDGGAEHSFGGSSTDTNAIHKTTASEIHGLTDATPATGDEFIFEDSSDSFNKKRCQYEDLVGALDITGMTDIGEALADGDEMPVYNLSGTANRKSALSRVKTYCQGIKLDDLATPDDNTDLNVSTTVHGLAPKAVAPASGLQNVLGIANGETALSNKPLFDDTNPSALGTASPGTQLISARRDHVHPTTGISTNPHGASQHTGAVLPGSTDEYQGPNCFDLELRAQPTGGGLPASGHLKLFADTSSGNLSQINNAGLVKDLATASGTDANAVHVNVASEIHGLTDATPATGDEFIFEDSSDSFNKKRCQYEDLVGSLDITGMTDIGEALADGDEFPVYNLSGTANRKSALSRVKTYCQGIKLDDLATPDDNTDLNASTTVHGLAPKATAPASGYINVLGIANGETVRTDKALFDSTVPSALGTAGTGSATTVARRDHVHASDPFVITETAGEAVVAGDLCYLKSDGKYWKAKADASSTTIGKLLIANASISADATGEFVKQGKFTKSSHGLTVGAPLYMSGATAGAYTATAPTTSNHYIRIIGYATTSSVITFEPDQAWGKVA